MLFQSIKTLFCSQPSVQVTWNTYWPSTIVIWWFWLPKAPLTNKNPTKICFQFNIWSIGPPIFAHKHQITISLSPAAYKKWNWALTWHWHYHSSSHGQQYLLIDREIRQKFIQHHIFGGVELTKWSFISNYWLLLQPTGTLSEENEVYRTFKVVFQNLRYLKISYWIDILLQSRHFSTCVTTFSVSAVLLTLFLSNTIPEDQPWSIPVL